MKPTESWVTRTKARKRHRAKHLSRISPRDTHREEGKRRERAKEGEEGKLNQSFTMNHKDQSCQEASQAKGLQLP